MEQEQLSKLNASMAMTETPQPELFNELQLLLFSRAAFAQMIVSNKGDQNLMRNRYAEIDLKIKKLLNL